MAFKNKKLIAARRLIYREQNKEKVAAADRAYYEYLKKHDLTRLIYNRLKRHAKFRNIPFNLSLDDIVIPKRCPVFGIVLRCGTGVSSPNSPSVDRINPTKGYVKGNIAIISNYANILKGKATASQHRRIADWMEQQIT